MALAKFCRDCWVGAYVLLVMRATWPWANRALASAARTPTGRLLDRIGNQWLGWLLLGLAIILPFTPLADQKTMDLSVLILLLAILALRWLVLSLP